jgi:hypothetical protein
MNMNPSSFRQHWDSAAAWVTDQWESLTEWTKKRSKGEVATAIIVAVVLLCWGTYSGGDGNTTPAGTTTPARPAATAAVPEAGVPAGAGASARPAPSLDAIACDEGPQADGPRYEVMVDSVTLFTSEWTPIGVILRGQTVVKQDGIAGNPPRLFVDCGKARGWVAQHNGGVGAARVDYLRLRPQQ